MMPIALIKRLRSLAFVNSVIMIMTLVSISIVIYYCCTIYKLTPDEIIEVYGLENVAPPDHLYRSWDPSRLALFLVGFQNVYEGNLIILNIYAEAKQPKNYIWNLATVMVFVTILVTIMGISGYLAFGEFTDDLILLNLPTGRGLSITAKFLYVGCICGSYILVL